MFILSFNRKPRVGLGGVAPKLDFLLEILQQTDTTGNHRQGTDSTECRLPSYALLDYRVAKSSIAKTWKSSSAKLCNLIGCD